MLSDQELSIVTEEEGNCLWMGGQIRDNCVGYCRDVTHKGCEFYGRNRLASTDVTINNHNL